MNHQKKSNVTQKLICRLGFQAPLLCPLRNKKKIEPNLPRCIDVRDRKNGGKNSFQTSLAWRFNFIAVRLGEKLILQYSVALRSYRHFV